VSDGRRPLVPGGASRPLRANGGGRPAAPGDLAADGFGVFVPGTQRLATVPETPEPSVPPPRTVPPQAPGGPVADTPAAPPLELPLLTDDEGVAGPIAQAPAASIRPLRPAEPLG